MEKFANPLREMKQLRSEISLTEREIKRRIKESKKAWSNK
jgi:hypothetical protein